VAACEAPDASSTSPAVAVHPFNFRSRPRSSPLPLELPNREEGVGPLAAWNAEVWAGPAEWRGAGTNIRVVVLMASRNNPFSPLAWPPAPAPWPRRAGSRASRLAGWLASSSLCPLQCRLDFPAQVSAIALQQLPKGTRAAWSRGSRAAPGSTECGWHRSRRRRVWTGAPPGGGITHLQRFSNQILRHFNS
jgi:hypothetical protein